jgi:CPA1 family monovalent cation:H+ antiporter
VSVYGLAAGPLARRLGLVQVNPQGILFIGAQNWARAMAHALKNEGCPVLLVDTDWENICLARMAGLPCIHGSALARHTREDIDYSGLGRLLAVTSNNEVNALACEFYRDDFGRQQVYQLPFPTQKQGRHELIPKGQHGRLLFAKELDYSRLSEEFGRNPKLRTTKLTKEFDFRAFKAEHGESTIVLFVIKPNGVVQVATVDGQLAPVAGDLVISVVPSETAPA